MIFCSFFIFLFFILWVIYMLLKSSISRSMCFHHHHHHHHLLPLRVNQMMSGNPNWWSLSSDILCSQAQKPCPSLLPQYAAAGSASPRSNSLANNQGFSPSWSQLLISGLASEEDKFGLLSHFHEFKKLENWDDQILNNPSFRVPVADVKQEGAQSSQIYGHGSDDDYEFQTCRPSWSQVMPPAVSSPSVSSTLSCGNILDFSSNSLGYGRNQHPDHSSECNSRLTGVVAKRARVQSSSTQPPLKVRKEKLGDRITALHQLVSPFGKTDTASVLLEAIAYIRFLQDQIEALTSPYLGNPSAHFRHQQPVQVDQRNCAFPVDSGQLLNDNCLKRGGAPPKKGNQDGSKDLRSRGLCLVPVSCTRLEEVIKMEKLLITGLQL